MSIVRRPESQEKRRSYVTLRADSVLFCAEIRLKEFQKVIVVEVDGLGQLPQYQ